MITLFFFASSPTRASTSRTISFRSSFSLGGAVLFCQRPNAGDHFTGSLSVANDVADSVTGFLKIGRISRQKTPASAAVADYTRQRLVDLMRNRGSQFSHHAHAVDVREICFEFAQSLPLCFGRLRSSMSVRIPCHRTIFPCSSRSGTLRARIQRYSPFAAERKRASHSSGSPLAREARHLSKNG